MWCQDCQQQVSVRLKPGESVVRCAQCGAKVSTPDRTRRLDAAEPVVAAPVVSAAASVCWSVAHASTAGVNATACPVSAAQSWLLDEDLRHIGRLSVGSLRRVGSQTPGLTELLQGRGLDESVETTYALPAWQPTAKPIEAAELRVKPQPVLQPLPTAVPEIQVPPLAGQLQAARKLSPLAIAVGHAASAMGGLALINGLALGVWARFGGRLDLTSLCLPICMTGLGLLFVSHLLHGSDAHAPRPTDKAKSSGQEKPIA